MASIDEEVKARFADDKQRFVTNVVFTAGWIRNMASNFLKPYGLSFQQYNILRILRGAGDWVAMNDLKDRMIEKAPNATRLVDKLLDKDLIQRQRCKSDRRVVFVHITSKGLDLIEEVDNNGKGEQSIFLTRITEEEARQMSAVLDRLRG